MFSLTWGTPKMLGRCSSSRNACSVGRAGHAPSNPLWRAILTVTDGILAVTVAYGRQPLLALVWLFLLWAVGVGVFWNAERLGALKPNSAVVLRSPEWTLCGIDVSQQGFLTASQQLASGRAQGGQTQLACYHEQFEASSYPEFNAWMYSLDALLPVLELDQKQYWRPNPPKPGGRLAMPTSTSSRC